MTEPPPTWILPASIPFPELKGRDLEECLYWLFDAMGAKDLEWRTGGSGGGASDGGRDLEAHFYTPGADSEVEPQTWWIECKGRKGTVEPEEVKVAVINAQAKAELDYIVIATNTQFSNPTRDWIKEWQSAHPRPKVKLWDSSHLERLLSRHPDVVLRLFSEALSVDGRFQAMESRFWNKLEFISQDTLAALWKARSDIEISGMGIFAAIANEFANGDITARPWGAILDAKSLLEVMQISLTNVSYLITRGVKGGADLQPSTRALAYLILCALDVIPADIVSRVVRESIFRGKEDEMPPDVRGFLLMPIVDQLVSEMQDVCTSDCERIMAMDRQTLTSGKDEIEDYWLRLDPEGKELVEKPRQYLRLEKTDAPCNVGFVVGDKSGCPLFAVEPTVGNLDEILGIVQRVASFRKAQAAEKRQSSRSP